jgi:cytochrome b involved in lipid metabolism
MESLFYLIGGLPVHALVVHFAVVILPIATLGVLAAIYLPKYASKFTFISIIALVIGTVFAYIASQSGEALSEKIGLPQNHANYGDILPNIAAVFTLLTIIWYLIKIEKIQKKIKFFNHLTALVGVVVMGLTFITGHTGAQAVWEGKIKSIEDLDAIDSNAQKQELKNGALGNESIEQGYISLTLAEVKKHSSGSDCWSVIYGNVYNLTSFVQRHPGGVSAISSLCGKDGTQAFDNQHGQSSKPNTVLTGLLLGRLGENIFGKNAQDPTLLPFANNSVEFEKERN